MIRTRIACICIMIFGLFVVAATGGSATSAYALEGSDTGRNLYKQLRDKALSMTPAVLELKAVEDDEVYGIVMDWHMSSGIMTLVAFRTGDASMYLSTGGGFIGGYKRENVKKATLILMDKARSFRTKGEITTTYPLPGKESIRFYLLTPKGIHTALIEKKHFEDQSSPWLSLFIDANNVITEFRKTVDSNR